MEDLHQPAGVAVQVPGQRIAVRFNLHDGGHEVGINPGGGRLRHDQVGPAPHARRHMRAPVQTPVDGQVGRPGPRDGYPCPHAAAAPAGGTRQGHSGRMSTANGGARRRRGRRPDAEQRHQERRGQAQAAQPRPAGPGERSGARPSMYWTRSGGARPITLPRAVPRQEPAGRATTAPDDGV